MKLFPGAAVGEDGSSRGEGSSFERTVQSDARGRIPTGFGVGVDEKSAVSRKRESESFTIQTALESAGGEGIGIEGGEYRDLFEFGGSETVFEEAIAGKRESSGGRLKPEYELGGIPEELEPELLRGTRQMEHGGVRVLGAPIGPRRDHGGNDLELCAFQFSLLASAEDVTPERFRLEVLHDEAAIPKHSGNTKVETGSFDICGIHDAVEAEMSPGGRECGIPDGIVDDLPGWTIQHIDWISAG